MQCPWKVGVPAAETSKEMLVQQERWVAWAERDPARPVCAAGVVEVQEQPAGAAADQDAEMRGEYLVSVCPCLGGGYPCVSAWLRV